MRYLEFFESRDSLRNCGAFELLTTEVKIDRIQGFRNCIHSLSATLTMLEPMVTSCWLARHIMKIIKAHKSAAMTITIRVVVFKVTS
jgi:hypothetical protein